jgi:hypothetical protein
LGYAYIPDISTGGIGENEKRGLMEITFRQPVGNAWLLSDRNRGELRDLDTTNTWRYRNRLRAERGIRIKTFRLTPYATVEAFYDGKVTRWNECDATFGSEFPWYYSTILEFYYTRQFIEHVDDNHIFGVTLQKHV